MRRTRLIDCRIQGLGIVVSERGVGHCDFFALPTQLSCTLEREDVRGRFGAGKVALLRVRNRC